MASSFRFDIASGFCCTVVIQRRCTYPRFNHLSLRLDYLDTLTDQSEEYLLLSFKHDIPNYIPTAAFHTSAADGECRRSYPSSHSRLSSWTLLGHLDGSEEHLLPSKQQHGACFVLFWRYHNHQFILIPVVDVKLLLFIHPSFRLEYTATLILAST